MSSVVPNPSAGDVYLGYFLGPSGGKKFLQALKTSPQAIASELFPSAAKANKNLFFDKKGSALTLAETYQKLTGKVQAYVADASSKASVLAATIPTSDESQVALSNTKTFSSSVAAPPVPVTPKTVQSTPIDVKLTPTEFNVASYAELSTLQPSALPSATPKASLVPSSNKQSAQNVDYVRSKSGTVFAIPS